MIKGFVETSAPGWPGENCATIFLPYCNLRCPYCYAHELVLHPDNLETLSLGDVLATLQSKKDRIDAVCIGGGEPTIHRDLPSILEAVHEAGFDTKLETNGTQPEILNYLFAGKLVDYVAVDVKAPLDDALYEQCAGVFVPVEIIKATLSLLTEAPVDTLFRCTVCPSLLEPDDIYRLAEDMKRLWSGKADGLPELPRLVLQNFTPDDPMEPLLKEATPFSEKDLARMQAEVDRILKSVS